MKYIEIVKEENGENDKQKKQKFIQYQLGRDIFSFFCDSAEQLELLNFLPDIQDLGLTACCCQKHRSPKRCLLMPKCKTCHNARASGTGPSAATAWKQKI